MSFVVTVPEAVAAAAGDLAAIGSTLREATAAAAGPTTGLAAAAADDVSIAVSQLFGRYGQEFQTVSNQLAAFHTEFVRTLNRGAAAYLNTESANGGQLFGQIEAGQRAVSAAAAAAPGGAYGQLVANTATNLESLYGAWSANPFPFLRQIIANQQVYWQQIAAALANAVQNFPALVANLPAAIDAAVQQFLAFNAAYYIQQIISSQIGFAQLFATTVGQGVTSVIAGWPNLAAELQLAFQQLLVGDYNAAVANLGKAMTNLLVTGFDTSDVTIGTMGTTISVTAKPKLLGPLGDLFTIMTIPAQEAQYFTNLMPPSILRDMSQNFTNVLTTLSNPNIQAVASFDIATTAGTLSTFFGVPLVLTYATLGAPFASLNAIATSAETIEQALLAGNYLGAVGGAYRRPGPRVRRLPQQRNRVGYADPGAHGAPVPSAPDGRDHAALAFRRDSRAAASRHRDDQLPGCSGSYSRFPNHRNRFRHTLHGNGSAADQLHSPTARPGNQTGGLARRGPLVGVVGCHAKLQPCG